MASGPDVTATFCATLVDEWVRGGVTDVVVCPGSRSTPLALAVVAESGLRVHVHHDERSAGFVALGLGLAARRPAVVVTTSGTTVANLHPAVVEAHQGHVPMIVATADRPPELQGVGAPQTIDQTHIFGRSVRWFAEPGVPDDLTSHTWRSLAARSVIEASRRDPGPVHLNLAFREPLVGVPADLPPARADGGPWHAVVADHGVPVARSATVQSLAETMASADGVLVAGAGCGGSEHVEALAARLGWPLLADPRSGLRARRATTVSSADAILRHAATAERLRPQVVVRLGEQPASKVLNGWLDTCGATQITVARSLADPGLVCEQWVRSRPSSFTLSILHELGDGPAPLGREPWLAGWLGADAAAQVAIEQALAAHPEPTEPGIARAVLAGLPAGSRLVCSSSMPVRDVEWFGAPRDGVAVLANRGANGIDGVVSTAVGVALAGHGPNALLIGDVALLHDTNGLLGLVQRGVDLTIVVVDNDGGGIFSFLPQAAALEPERFEQLFGTPHGVDLTALAGAHGIELVEVTTAADVGPAVAASAGAGGTRILRARTDRVANVAVHDEIHSAVATALDALSTT